MDDDEIHAIADDAGTRIFENIPDEYLTTLDEDEQAQLLVDLQDALTEVIRKALGKTASR
jgi:hypothetical protein